MFVRFICSDYCHFLCKSWHIPSCIRRNMKKNINFSFDKTWKRQNPKHKSTWIDSIIEPKRGIDCVHTFGYRQNGRHNNKQIVEMIFMEMFDFRLKLSEMSIQEHSTIINIHDLSPQIWYWFSSVFLLFTYPNDETIEVIDRNLNVARESIALISHFWCAHRTELDVIETNYQFLQVCPIWTQFQSAHKL